MKWSIIDFRHPLYYLRCGECAECKEFEENNEGSFLEPLRGEESKGWPCAELTGDYDNAAAYNQMAAYFDGDGEEEDDYDECLFSVSMIRDPEDATRNCVSADPKDWEYPNHPELRAFMWKLWSAIHPSPSDFTSREHVDGEKVFWHYKESSSWSYKTDAYYIVQREVSAEMTAEEWDLLQVKVEEWEKNRRIGSFLRDSLNEPFYPRGFAEYTGKMKHFLDRLFKGTQEQWNRGRDIINNDKETK